MDLSRLSKKKWVFVSILVLLLAVTLSSEVIRSLMIAWTIKPVSTFIASFYSRRKSTTTTAKHVTMSTKAPVYFFSHGGPNVQYETKHPAYPVLQKIGQEITKKVKPKAVVVFSGHWESTKDTIHINTAEDTDLIYDFYGFPPHYYEAKYPNKGSSDLANKIMGLLKDAGIKVEGVTRGLDHGVWSGFHVETNPLGVPLVQVSLYSNEDPVKHYRLGQAITSLRDENIVIIGAGMSVHNLRDLMFSRGDPRPMPYTVSFDNALKEAVEAPPSERMARMAEIVRRPDARQAHPRMDHLMPVYIAAGAAGFDTGKQTWTLHEGSMAWAQYRFGDVPLE